MTGSAASSAAAGGRAEPACARVARIDELPAALDALGVRRGRPVLLLIGGAGGMSDEHLDLASRVIEPLIPALDEWGAAVVDGGTDAGVMRAVGTARSAARARFPLIGVAAEGTVAVPGVPPAPHLAALAPGHTHLIFVPGREWGDESPWLSLVAAVIAGSRPSLAVVINGGQITYDDIGHTIEAGRPALVLDGTGRTADAIAAAVRGQDDSDPRAAEAARAPGLRIAPATDPDGVRAAIRRVLAPRHR